MRKAKRNNAFILIHDLFMISIGIIFAIFISGSGLLDYVINLFNDYYILTSFVTGIFFTSVFTLAPSSVALIHLANNYPISGVIFWGGLGAMFGDLILFLFVRDRFSEDLKKVFRPKQFRIFFKSLHFGFMKWLSPIIGALIIASPLPDEFGITLLGMSKIRTIVLMPVAFIMNMLGIYALIEFSRFL